MWAEIQQKAVFDFHVLMQGMTLTQITVPFESTTNFKAMDTFSGEFVWNNLTLAGEYYTTDGEVTSEGQVVAAVKNEAYYGQATYRLNKTFEAGAYYSVQYPDYDDKNGQNLKAQGQPDYLAWQKDICMALRIDMNEYWLVKFETHIINGAGQLTSALNPDGYKQNWQLFAVKTAITF